MANRTLLLRDISRLTLSCLIFYIFDCRVLGLNRLVFLCGSAIRSGTALSLHVPPRLPLLFIDLIFSRLVELDD
jgi:hypothetical protein